MTGKRIGYIRVSTAEQNPDRQLEGIALDKKFIDYSSARGTNRPQLKAMLEFIREDDVILVHSMDRLARNVRDLRRLVDECVSRKIEVHFMKENLRFTGKECAMSNLLLSVMGAMAEFEHAFILERQREGIAIAKKLGIFNRPKKLTSRQIELLEKEVQTTRRTRADIAKQFGISRHTLYKYLRDRGKDQQNAAFHVDAEIQPI